MGKRKHKSPSRIRYEKTHPVVSFRVKDEWKNEFKTFLQEQNLSIGDFFRISYGKQKANYQEAHDQGFDEGFKIGYNEGKTEGYKLGMNDWAIWCYCWKCLKPIFIKPNSDAHKKMIDAMSGHLGHMQCPED